MVFFLKLPKCTKVLIVHFPVRHPRRRCFNTRFTASPFRRGSVETAGDDRKNHLSSAMEGVAINGEEEALLRSKFFSVLLVRASCSSFFWFDLLFWCGGWRSLSGLGSAFPEVRHHSHPPPASCSHLRWRLPPLSSWYFSFQLSLFVCLYDEKVCGLLLHFNFSLIFVGVIGIFVHFVWRLVAWRKIGLPQID